MQGLGALEPSLGRGHSLVIFFMNLTALEFTAILSSAFCVPNCFLAERLKAPSSWGVYKKGLAIETSIADPFFGYIMSEFMKVISNNFKTVIWTRPLEAKFITSAFCYTSQYHYFISGLFKYFYKTSNDYCVRLSSAAVSLMTPLTMSASDLRETLDLSSVKRLKPSKSKPAGV